MARRRLGGHPPAQRLHLRHRRDHRSLHLHQADRPDPRGAARLLRSPAHAHSISAAQSLSSSAGCRPDVPLPVVGVGLSQFFFTHQADGSITANGSTLIGQDWSKTKCPGNLPGSCVFQGRPDARRPLRRIAEPGRHPGDNPLVANPPAGRAELRGVRGHQPRSTLAGAARLHEGSGRLLEGALVNPTSDLVTTSGSGFDPDISPRTHKPRSRWSHGPPGSRLPLQDLVISRPRGMNSASWALLFGRAAVQRGAGQTEA